MPAKVRGAAASEGEVRLTVAFGGGNLRGLGVEGELDALVNALLGQRKAGCYKAK